MKYIVCVYGNFQNRDSVLRNTIASGEYVLGAKAPNVLNNANVGDVLLLSIDQKIIAYGKVLKPLEALPNPDKDRKYRLIVEKWIVLDSIAPSNGISTKGISFACENGSSPDEIAKEVSPEWFLERFKEFQTRKISFRESVIRFFKGFFKFRGTATKTELWHATLFGFIVGMAFLILESIVSWRVFEIINIGNFLIGILLIIPFLALCVRRCWGSKPFPSPTALLFIPIAAIASFCACMGIFISSLIMFYMSIFPMVLLPVFTAALVGLTKNHFELPVESVTSECGNETVSQKSEKMSFGKAVGRFWKGYFKFSGRATRSEFWFAILLNIIVGGIIFLCIADYVQLADICGGNDSVTGNVAAFFLMIGNLWTLATFFPFLALYARRLHDTNRSAWNLLWCILVIPGIYYILVMGFSKGTTGRNRFGDPV